MEISGSPVALHSAEHIVGMDPDGTILKSPETPSGCLLIRLRGTGAVGSGSSGFLRQTSNPALMCSIMTNLFIGARDRKFRLTGCMRLQKIRRAISGSVQGAVLPAGSPPKLRERPLNRENGNSGDQTPVLKKYLHWLSTNTTGSGYPTSIQDCTQSTRMNSFATLASWTASSITRSGISLPITRGSSGSQHGAG